MKLVKWNGNKPLRTSIRNKSQVAVVANEVRKLAEQSSQSAKQIADVIHTIQQETEEVAASQQHAAANHEQLANMEGIASSAQSFMIYLNYI